MLNHKAMGQRILRVNPKYSQKILHLNKMDAPSRMVNPMRKILRPMVLRDLNEAQFTFQNDLGKFFD